MSNKQSRVETVVGIRAASREVLLGHAYLNDPLPPGQPLIRVVLPCGRLREWTSRESVPAQSAECNCGELPYRHWFIRYGEEP